MKNYIQAGENISLAAAPYDVASGAGVLAGVLFGIAQGSALSGSPVTIARRGVFQVNKTGAQAWAVGAKIYWDDTAKDFTSVATANRVVGCAVLAATNPSDAGTILLDGAIR
jgi:predicted RecA/RadA family phage recombinase